MSTAMNFGSKSFQPRPPDKGSFPLDHFVCFQRVSGGNQFSKAGEGGRQQLMAREPLEKLGFGDLIDGKSETKTEP
eukprot:bmy_08939T0